MKIESIIRRPGGSLVSLGTAEYRFKPETEDGPHVCEVSVQEHISALLGIREGFREFGAPIVEILDEPENEEAPTDPELISHKDLAQWAAARGIAPKSSKSIADYAKATYGADLDMKRSLPDLLRDVVRLERRTESSEG